MQSDKITDKALQNSTPGLRELNWYNAGWCKLEN